MLRQFIYDNVPLEQLDPQLPGKRPDEPWRSFEQARQLARTGQQDARLVVAVEIPQEPTAFPRREDLLGMLRSGGGPGSWR